MKRTNPIIHSDAPAPPNLDRLPEIYKTIPDNIAYFVKTPEVITKDHDILDVDHINQQEIDILKQAYSGVKPIIDQLEILSAAGLVALFLLYEHTWDQVHLKMNIAKMTHHRNRREKNMKFTARWKKNKETNEALRAIVLLDTDISNRATISENITVNENTLADVLSSVLPVDENSKSILILGRISYFSDFFSTVFTC